MRRSLPVVLVAAALLCPAAAHASTYTVSVSTDANLTGSLRNAIGLANANPGPDTIDIAIGGAQTIALGSQLPTITSPLTIEGPGPGPDGAPLLLLSCTTANAYDGLEIASDVSATITGLSVARCASDIAVRAGASLTLTSSYVGFGLDGAASPGGTNGVYAASSTSGHPTSLTLGGPDAADGNVIAGGTTGVNAQGVDSAILRNNRIGTTIDGAQAVTHAVGVLLSARTATIADNQIAGASGGPGATSADLKLLAVAGAQPAQVLRNRFGIASDDATALSHAGSNVAVAGAAVLRDNVVAGSIGGSGVSLYVPDVVLTGNRICTNTAGTAPSTAHSTFGIYVDTGASGATIGGDAADAGNLVAGCGGVGILVASTGATIRGNLIGAAIDGTTPLPSGAAAVGLGASAASASSGNTVAANRIVGVATAPGIQIVGAGSAGNALLSNLISGAKVGIDLAGDGPTPNDDGDVDAGPNGLQNAPVLSNATTASATSTIDTTPKTEVRVQAFSSNAAGTAALSLLADTTVTTDDTGHALVALPTNVPVGTPVIETATTTDGTSEFSAPFVAAATQSTGGTLLPVVSVPKQANVGLQPVVAAPVKVPPFGLSVSKVVSDGRRMALGVKNTGKTTVKVLVGGTDQPKSARSTKPGIALPIVTHTIKPGKTVSFTITIPSASRSTIRAALKRHRSTTYRPTIIVRNATTTGQRAYEQSLKIRR
ncbi:MAG: hypothetical protein AAGC46_17575 [Solirubrobacteraceae bacterium]|nr:right-handed parallel beta-helix repeat-containing protein [Patulibacter sp.]